MWTFEATEKLIRLVKENEKRLHDRKTKKINVWGDIARSLQELVSYCTRCMSLKSYLYFPPLSVYTQALDYESH